MQVLVGTTLIDGTGALPVADAAVVIDGERIIAAGPRGSAPWPAHAEVVDLSGLTLLPGLIDTHDHLASHGYALSTRWGLDEPASTTTSISSAVPPSAKPRYIKLPTDTAAMRARLEAKLEALVTAESGAA